MLFKLLIYPFPQISPFGNGDQKSAFQVSESVNVHTFYFFVLFITVFLY